MQQDLFRLTSLVIPRIGLHRMKNWRWWKQTKKKKWKAFNSLTVSFLGFRLGMPWEKALYTLNELTSPLYRAYLTAFLLFAICCDALKWRTTRHEVWSKLDGSSQRRRSSEGTLRSLRPLSYGILCRLPRRHELDETGATIRFALGFWSLHHLWFLRSFWSLSSLFRRTCLVAAMRFRRCQTLHWTSIPLTRAINQSFSIKSRFLTCSDIVRTSKCTAMRR